MPVAAPDLIGLVERLQVWARERHQIVDVFVAGVAMIVSIGDVVNRCTDNE
jgi:hypothetical protein